jgi:hypothetical protein
MCRGFQVIRRGIIPVTEATGKAMDETCKIAGYDVPWPAQNKHD